MKKHETFSVRFITRANRGTKNELERLHLRITVAGERVEISLGKEISAGIFDQNAQRCPANSKEAKAVNSFLDTIIYKVNDLRRSLLLDGEEITTESLRRAYMGIPLTDEPSQTILGLYEKHNSKLKELINIDIAEATHKRHETSKMHVAGFTLSFSFANSLP